MAQDLWNVSSSISYDAVGDDLIDSKNYATDTKVVDRVQDHILKNIPAIKSERSDLESRWGRLERMWQGKHEMRLVDTQSDIYVPMGRKIVETFVAQVTTQIFPTNPLFFLNGIGPNQQLAAALTPHIGALIENDIEQANVRSHIPLFLRRGFIAGCSIVKNFWKTTSTTNYRKRRYGGGPNEPILTTIESEKVNLYDGPTFDVVDPLRWYIYPITSKSIDDARLVFEEVDVDWTHLKSMEKAGIYKGVDKIKDMAGAKSGTGIVDSNRDIRTLSYGYTVQEEILNDTYRLTEIWAKFDLYGDSNLIPCKIVVCGGQVLEVRQNPFFSQRPPYRAWRMTDVFDNFYGMGLMENIESMQYAFNAMFNQGIDNANWQQNPMIVINKANLASNPSDITIAPRSFLYTYGDPRTNVHFERPPETYKISFDVAQQLSGMMQDIAGAPPILQGKMGNRTQTATEADILRAGAGAFTNIVATKLESEVLSPMLHDFYMLEQQFRDGETYAKITGGQPPLPISPQDLVGDYQFTWHVSTDAAQRMMMLQAQGGGMTAAPGGQGGPEGGGPPQGEPPQGPPPGEPPGGF